VRRTRARLKLKDLMSGAFAWGLLAASSLVIGNVIALLVPIHARVVGLVMGFGAGV
jgi:zinc transporter, ZIP family